MTTVYSSTGPFVFYNAGIDCNAGYQELLRHPGGLWVLGGLSWLNAILRTRMSATADLEGGPSLYCH